MNAASGTKVKNLALAGLCTAFMAVVAPLSIPIGPISRTQRMALRLAGVLAGQLVCYALGTVWFMFVSGMGLWASLTVCVLPFIIPDFLKGLGALALAGAIRRRLKL